MESSSNSRARLWSLIATGGLALLAGLIVVVQSTRIAAIWDVSYVSDAAYRISVGDVPYRDFGIVHTPGTFLIQALIIRLFGPSLSHEIVYCAVVSSFSVVLTALILTRLRGFGPMIPVLCLPVGVVGLYGVYSYPLQDPDATFAMLIALSFLLWCRAAGFHSRPMLVAGCLSVLPLLFKQNTGLVFLVAVHGVLFITAAFTPRELARRSYLAFLVGSFGALLVLAVIVGVTCGFERFFYWTWEFPSQTRLPGLLRVLGWYNQVPVWLALACWGVVGLLLARGMVHSLVTRLITVLLTILPVLFLPVLFRVAAGLDVIGTGFAIWPVAMILLACGSIVSLRAQTQEGLFVRLFPWAPLLVVSAAFLSYGFADSNYGIVPILVIMLGLLLRQMEAWIPGDRARLSRRFGWAACAIAVLYAVSIGSQWRLGYLELEGEVAAASLEPLRGLHTPGPWIPEMESFLQFAEREIPSDEGVLLWPGEDPFHFALQRRSRMPQLTHDISSPFSAEQLLATALSRDVRWLVVKTRTQLGERTSSVCHEANGRADERSGPCPKRDRLLEVFKPRYSLYLELPGYQIYRLSSSHVL